MSLNGLISKIRLDGVRINRPPQIYRCEPAWRWQPPALEDFDLWYVMAGAGEMLLEGRKFSIVANRCFVLWPEARPDTSHDPRRPLRVFAVHFDLLDARGRAMRRCGAMPPVDVSDPGFFDALARRCDMDWREGNEDGERRAKLSLAQMLLHLAAPPAPTRGRSVASDEAVAMLVRRVREDPGQRRSVQEMADEAGISRSQLARRFIRATGLSPEAFLIQARVERARHLLSETQLPLAAIAQSLGYCDAYYFCRQFKSVTGQTPGRYRDAR
jgi:AraC-like DNA-binding protein